MNLPSDLVSEFAKITNDTKEKNTEGTTVYGTYRVQGEKAYVQIDGSDQYTPVATTSEAKAGDRVMVLIKDHKAVVTGNLEDPSASQSSLKNLGDSLAGAEKVATNYIEFQEDIGLVLGNMTAETLGKNVLIDATGVDIRDGNEVIASYTAEEISLGKNNKDSKIKLCGELGQISAGKANSTFVDWTGDVMKIKSKGGLELYGSNIEDEDGDGFWTHEPGYVYLYTPNSELWMRENQIQLFTGVEGVEYGFTIEEGYGVTIHGDLHADISGYATEDHTHTEYADSYHTHNDVSYGGARIAIGLLSGECNFRPTNASYSYALGSNSWRWDTVYAVAVDETSDIRLKENFSTNMDKYIQMLDLLEPLSYEWISEGDNPERKRNVGYGAQYVKMAMEKVGLDEKDFGGLNKYMQEEGPVYGYSLRYSQFIPILHAKIKKLESRIDDLEARLAKLEGTAE